MLSSMHWSPCPHSLPRNSVALPTKAGESELELESESELFEKNWGIRIGIGIENWLEQGIGIGISIEICGVYWNWNYKNYRYYLPLM